MEELVTILTPTYNREKEIVHLYESLLHQTNKNFIWMVIDDGSSDHTEQIITEMIDNSAFQIIYLKKENGGKHTALNLGFQRINTYFTFIVDSDDVLTSDAVNTVYEYYHIVESENLSGVSFLRGYSAEKCIGDMFPMSEHIDNDINIRLKRNITGDKAEVWRTDILGEYQFPVFEGERFQGENYVWWQIARKYNMLYVNKIIYITEYLDGGLTKSGRALRLKNPRGGMENCRQAFHPEFPFKTRVKYTILYGIYGYLAGMTEKEIIKSSGNCLMPICILPSKLAYLYWKRKFLQ